jgi:hypothetical protein
MMNTRIAVVAVALSFAAGVFCFAAEPAASPAAANPHMGTWKLNEAKSKIPAGMYKNTTAVYSEMKDEMKVEVNGVDKDGKPTHGVWTGKADGKAYKTKGNLAWDSAAYKAVNDHTYAITTMKGGKVFTHGTSTVSKDGKTRTVATEGTGADGKKFKSKAVYDKE